MVPGGSWGQPGPASGRLHQQDLPALSARKAAAEARLAAAERYFSAQGPLAASFPDLAGTPLGSADFLTAQRLLLDQRSADRAAERIAPIPDGLSEGESARLQRERAAALDAEDRADQTRRRLLDGLGILLTRAPGLSEVAISARLAELGDARAALGPITAPHPDAPLDPTLSDRIFAVQRLGDTERRLRDLQAAAQRALTVPGDETLEAGVREELDALSSDAEPALRADLLKRARPLLAPAMAAAVTAAIGQVERTALETEIAALTAEIGALPEAPESPADAAALRAAVATQEAAVAQAAVAAAAEPPAGETATPEVRLTAEVAQATLRHETAALAVTRARLPLPAGSDPELAARRLEAARLRAMITQRDLEGVRERLDALKRSRVAEPSAEELEASHRRTEEARAASARAEGAIAQQRSRMTAEIAQQVEHLITARASGGADVTAHQDRLDQLVSEQGEVLLLSTLLNRENRDRIDEHYRALSTLHRQIRDGLDAQEASLETLSATAEVARAQAERCVGVSAQGDDDPLLRACADLGAELAALPDRRTQILDQREVWVELLKAVRRAMRALAEEHSIELTQESGRGFSEQIAAELQIVPVILASDLRRLAGAGRAGFRNPDLIVEVLSRSVEFFILLAIWVPVRRRLGVLVPEQLARVESLRLTHPPESDDWFARMERWIEPGDLRLLSTDASLLVQNLWDAIILLPMLGYLQREVPTLGLLAMIWLAIAIYRVGVLGLRVALSHDDAPRPSLDQITPAAWRLAMRSTRAGLVLVLGYGLLADSSVRLLHALLLPVILGWLATAAAWISAFVLLHMWAPHIRTAVAEMEQNRISALLVRQVRSPLLRAPHAAACLIYLVVVGSLGVAERLLEQRSGLTWLSAIVARRQLSESEALPSRPLTLEQADAVREALGTPPRSDIEATLREAYQEWGAQDTPRRGLVALTGDRGSGRSALLDRTAGILATERPVRLIRLPQPTIGEQSALEWLADALELPEVRDATSIVPALIAALRARPSEVIVLENTHLLFLRAVDGYAGLRRVLGVLHATSERHFWICGFHGPTWWFLQGVSEAIGLAVFRTHIPLGRIPPDQLRDWLEEATQTSGLAFSYRGLVSDGVLGVSVQRAEARARSAFWRLLAEAGQGAPHHALEAWLQCLRQGDGAALVSLFSSPPAPAANDRELFVLTALIIHDGLDLSEQERALNLPVDICRAQCRRLEADGVLERDDAKRYRVRWDYLPVIERILRMRHFLHER